MLTGKNPLGIEPNGGVQFPDFYSDCTFRLCSRIDHGHVFPFHPLIDLRVKQGEHQRQKNVKKMYGTTSSRGDY
jgi:hypothetical protein